MMTTQSPPPAPQLDPEWFEEVANIIEQELGKLGPPDVDRKALDAQLRRERARRR